MKLRIINKDWKYLNQFMDENPIYFPQKEDYSQTIDDFVYQEYIKYVKQRERDDRLDNILK